MRYAVQVIGRDDLPEGVDRVIVERNDGSPLVLLTPEAARTWRMLRAWEADQREPVEVVELRAV